MQGESFGTLPREAAVVVVGHSRKRLVGERPGQAATPATNVAGCTAYIPRLSEDQATCSVGQRLPLWVTSALVAHGTVPVQWPVAVIRGYE